MKLAKLSLAAVLAAGSFSMANAAVSLEQAIKDVEISGMLRYRLDGSRVKYQEEGADKVLEEHENMNKFRGDLNTSIVLDGAEDFKANFGIRFTASDGNGMQVDDGKPFEAPLTAGSITKTDYVTTKNTDGTYTTKAKNGAKSQVLVRQFNVEYNNKDQHLTVIAGRQALDTFYTAGIIGDGVVAQSDAIDGITFVGFYVANLDKHNSDNNLRAIITRSEPVYGLGVLTEFAGVNANFWGVQARDIASLAGMDAGADIEVADDTKIKAKVQVSYTAVDSMQKNATLKLIEAAQKYNADPLNSGKPEKDVPSELKDSFNFNVNAGFEAAGFDFLVGYAQIGNKKGHSLVTAHDSGAFDSVGEILMAYNHTEGQTNYIYASIGTEIDKYSAALEYVNAKTKFDKQDSVKGNEYVARLGYKYSKKISLSAYYAYADVKDGEISKAPGKGDKAKAQQYRLEAKYKF